LAAGDEARAIVWRFDICTGLIVRPLTRAAVFFVA
jgi:hypothetical protein